MIGAIVALIGVVIWLLRGNDVNADIVKFSAVAAGWFIFSFWVLFVPHEEIPANLAVESLKIPDDRGFEKE